MGAGMEQELKDNWTMRRCGEEAWQEAVVPGTVYTDLLRNGKIEDPFRGDLADEICALMESDYEYCCSFETQPGLTECDTVLLHFDGLDTVAQIWLNGKLLGRAENMHRVWEYEVKDCLKTGGNRLLVRFSSPLKFIAKAHRKYGNLGNDDTFEGFMHLRKAHYMFGWDWAAHLPDAGIFRPVRLIGVNTARLDSVYITQRFQDGEAVLKLQVTVNPAERPGEELALRAAGTGELVRAKAVPDRDRTESRAETGDDRKRIRAGAETQRDRMNTESGGDSGIENLSYTVTVTGPDGFVRRCAGNPEEIRIPNPRLWWPNGLGEQPLYTVETALLDREGGVLDTLSRRVGLRTLTVRREKDRWGECFAHEVNGLSVFAMGADYIPEDHLLGRVSKERTKKLLAQCREAHFNTVRVWGGGLYPEDWFYDLCDEMGLMVWQDFMFACSVYELTPAFEENIRREFVDNVKRIRHHACLALWCGNNEMELFVKERNWVTKDTEVLDYLFMYERIIPRILGEYDPQTFYWPASPSSGGSFDEPNDPGRGDVHFWEVWHGGKPFTEYRKHFFRYASEFGFQSFPSVKTLETVIDDPRDLNPFSYVCEKHQRSLGGNGKLLGYLQQMYRYPMDFPGFVYVSQLLQAEAVRYGVEHFRRNRGRCMGAVYWQLNDCWPAVSWSSIDYAGRWKALQYYAKRFFAPLLISCEEQGEMSSGKDMNRQHFTFEKSIRLNAANETRRERRVTVRWAVRDSLGGIREEWEREMTLPPLSAVWLEKQELPGLNIREEYVSYELIADGEEISSGTVLFTYPKYFRFQDPGLAWRLEGNQITVSAGAYAKGVEICNDAEDLILSDNYFDMNGGARSVTILGGRPENIRVRSVYDI